MSICWFDKVSPSSITGGRVRPSGPGHSLVSTLENPQAQCSKDCRAPPTHLARPASGTATLLFSWTPGQPVSGLSLLLSCRPVWRPPVVGHWGSWGGPAGSGAEPSLRLRSCRPGDQGWATWWRAVGKRKRGRPVPAGSSHGSTPLTGAPPDRSHLAPQLPAPQPTCSSGFLLGATGSPSGLPALRQEPRELAVT